MPFWVVLSRQSAMALGTVCGGWRIVRTVGSRITHLTPVQGFCAEMGGALALYGATWLGIPVSTTHTSTGSQDKLNTSGASAVPTQCMQDSGEAFGHDCIMPDIQPPLLQAKNYAQPSVFRPEHLLREARRQRGLPDRDVPAICVLDPDGDLVRYGWHRERARPSPGWACYHTELSEITLKDGTIVGVVGNAVGAPFAVLVAEQLFASGCRFLISITSAGRIADLGEPPYVVLIDRALRDEGTSLHYLPPEAGNFVSAPNPVLLARVEAELRTAFPPASGTPVHRGATWTTDAPYRETETAITDAAAQGVLAVEMEAAALYAFATARGALVTCFAHVTNTMGQRGGDDFEKGEEEGAVTALRVIDAAAKAFRAGELTLPRYGGHLV